MILLKISNCLLCVRSSEISSIYQTSIRHYSKADKMKKLMKEMKLIFGSVLETNIQRKRKLKLEAKEIPPQKSNKIDTEFSWVMEQSLKNPKKNSLKRISVSSKQQSKREDTNQTNSTNSPENLNTEATECKSPSNQNNNSQKTSMKKISVSAKQRTEHDHASRTNSTNSSENLSTGTLEDKRLSNQNTDDTSHSESSQHTQKITPETISQSKFVNSDNSHGNISLCNSNTTDIENAVTKPNISDKIFDIVVKNIHSFSIMGSKRESSAKSMEALSVAGKKDQNTIKFPSVTRILTHTMSPESKQALEMWKKKMIKLLGQEGFDSYQKALLSDGISLHRCVAHSLLEKEYEVPAKIEPVFNSVQSVLKDIYDVKAIETNVSHTKLRYKGIVDCVASYRGENYVIDWKKSDKKKLCLRETYDAPVQVAAYIGAINASNLYPSVIKRGLIVIAYTCGDPATVHEVCANTLQEYWTTWLRRLQQYHVDTLSKDNTSNKTLM